MKRANLGDILLEMGAIDRLQLQAALAHQRRWGTRLGRAVVEHRFCTLDQVMSALSQQAGLPVVDLDAAPPDELIASLLNAKVAQRHKVVPLRLEGRRHEVLVVAIAAPASLEALDEVRTVAGKQRVVAYLASDEQLDRHIARMYLRGALPPPAPRPSEAAPGEAFDLEQIEAAPRRERPVLIYGWTEDAGRNIAVVLSAEGISAKVAGALEVLRATAEDVVLAPLAAMETVLRGERFVGRLVVVGKSADDDLDRAHRLGALGFVEAPLDTELLIRSVRRCRPAATPVAQA